MSKISIQPIDQHPRLMLQQHCRAGFAFEREHGAVGAILPALRKGDASDLWPDNFGPADEERGIDEAGARKRSSGLAEHAFTGGACPAVPRNAPGSVLRSVAFRALAHAW